MALKRGIVPKNAVLRCFWQKVCVLMRYLKQSPPQAWHQFENAYFQGCFRDFKARHLPE
jgi:hypothetical protein